MYPFAYRKLVAVECGRMVSRSYCKYFGQPSMCYPLKKRFSHFDQRLKMVSMFGRLLNLCVDFYGTSITNCTEIRLTPWVSFSLFPSLLFYLKCYINLKNVWFYWETVQHQWCGWCNQIKRVEVKKKKLSRNTILNQITAHGSRG